MNHLDTDILVPYLDGELSAEEMECCREHLRQCASCRSQAEQLNQVWGLLDAVPVPVVAEGFAAAVVARAAEERSVSRGSVGRGSRRRRIAVPLAAAAAVALIVLYRPGPATHDVVPGPKASLVVDDNPVAPTANDIELIFENREVLDVMQEYPELIKHYDLLRAVDRALQDEHITS